MCLICDRIRLGEENPFFVAEMSTGIVVIGDHQYFRGYTLFLCKRHVVELYDLDEEFLAAFMKETAAVAKAVAKAFGAAKMNIELLGNKDSHLHWHLFPRREGDLGDYGVEGRGPVWLVPGEELFAPETKPSPEELDDLKRTLHDALGAYASLQ
jgi:diadenosine tetraphosphate (Ap4A) HIT family hydrolase